jgi:hypothetical protein
MAFNSSKSAILPRTIKAHLLLAELQAEARRERFAASFDQHFADDDCAREPEPDGQRPSSPCSGGVAVTLPLDYQIDAAHHEAQRIENEALAIEARIIAAGGPPVRRYGTPVSREAVSRNLTTTGLLQRRDPALAAYLGIGSDYHLKQQQAAEARRLQVEQCKPKLSSYGNKMKPPLMPATGSNSAHVSRGGGDVVTTPPALWMVAFAAG